jgi:hypothetical protein
MHVESIRFHTADSKCSFVEVKTFSSDALNLSTGTSWQGRPHKGQRTLDQRPAAFPECPQRKRASPRQESAAEVNGAWRPVAKEIKRPDASRAF